MKGEKHGKTDRVLAIYLKLSRGQTVNKRKMADLFNVSEKTIQRDIKDIRGYLANNIGESENRYILYNQGKGGYYFENIEDILNR